MTNINTQLLDTAPVPELTGPLTEPGADPELTVEIAPERRMEGWFRDLIASEREPLMTREEVAQKWGIAYGSLVAKVVLPSRESLIQDPNDPKFQHDLARRTLLLFDARDGRHSAPQYVVASLTAVARVAEEPVMRGLFAGMSGDIHEVTEGKGLLVGAAGADRWLPRSLRRYETAIARRGKGGHATRRVISNEQTRFYVGEEGELHVRSEGHNPDVFIAHPNSAERRHSIDVKSGLAGLHREVAAGRAARAADLLVAHTTSLASPVVRTTYLSRHGSNLTHTVVGSPRV